MTCFVESPCTEQPSNTAAIVFFDAVISADHRHFGAFRWPIDDSWVMPVMCSTAILREELELGHGAAARTILEKVHRCGASMAELSPMWHPEKKDEGKDKVWQSD